MCDELIPLLSQLGTSAENIVLIYLLLDYGTAWVMICLAVWAARTIWKHETRRNG